MLISNPVHRASQFKDELDFTRLISVLWRGKALIACITLFTLMCGYYYTAVIVTPLYTTTATLVQNTNQEPLVEFSSGLAGSLGGDLSEMNTQIKIMRSRGLLELLAIELDLVIPTT